MQYKNDKVTITGRSCNKKFELFALSYSALDTQFYFDYMTKQNETFTDKSLIEIYFDKVSNKIKFKIKMLYYLINLTLKFVKLLGKTTKRKNGEKNWKCTTIIKS